ncbi:hypothetical protein FIBSPDRAFT_463877 [Athelia psychrophila]|uniref:Uncharacterized protein n=1 Tax=Athelia psychrophila TaxID=1759441 RepID=A0A166LPZ4_9AGAM|nr:hypothetical protein FIBSPDRAFT_463877 [Fibularhizoctonia sp. CBS 109695]
MQWQSMGRIKGPGPRPVASILNAIVLDASEQPFERYPHSASADVPFGEGSAGVCHRHSCLYRRSGCRGGCGGGQPRSLVGGCGVGSCCQFGLRLGLMSGAKGLEFVS